jgi:hypothetical protein
MSEFDRDKLVEKVNAKLTKLVRQKPIPAILAQRQRLMILVRRYAGGERTEFLFKAMELETAE